jgi:hypothetical protein
MHTTKGVFGLPSVEDSSRSLLFWRSKEVQLHKRHEGLAGLGDPVSALSAARQ